MQIMIFICAVCQSLYNISMQYAAIIIRLHAVVSKYQFMPIYFALCASLRDGGVVTQAAINMRIATSR